VTIELSKSELMIVSNAINEICYGPDAIEDWEFNLRVGALRIEAEARLDRLSWLHVRRAFREPRERPRKSRATLSAAATGMSRRSSARMRQHGVQARC